MSVNFDLSTHPRVSLASTLHAASYVSSRQFKPPVLCITQSLYKFDRCSRCVGLQFVDKKFQKLHKPHKRIVLLSRVSMVSSVPNAVFVQVFPLSFKPFEFYSHLLQGDHPLAIQALLPSALVASLEFPNPTSNIPKIVVRRTFPYTGLLRIANEAVMVKFYDSISEELGAWAQRQSVFFTASAPLTGKHINISPKGLPSSSFSILGPNQAAYVDATGSGSETIAHVYENGRITIMFCSFDASPRILRFFCIGKVIEWDQPEFQTRWKQMGITRPVEGARAIILLDVFKVQTSCGFGVPRHAKVKGDRDEDKEEWMAGFEDRETLGHWASKRIEANTLNEYHKQWNYDSLDGLTGLRVARKDKGETLWLTDLQAWFRRIMAQREALAFGFTLASILFIVARLVIPTDAQNEAI